MSALQTFLASHPVAILVEVDTARGSTPREAGAFMLVAAEAVLATIGGGQLEFMAIDHARALLAGSDRPLALDVPLGPEIGQCCGGRVGLRFRFIDDGIARALLAREASEHDRLVDVHLFGAGHVGLALARALAPLPFRTTVVETREIAEAMPEGVALHRVALPEAEVATIRPGGAAVILTHDHALDFLIARAALDRADLAYVGMIGSATKRATFVRWLAREGGDRTAERRLVLPIGGDTVKDKRPAVIAALVAAELLATLLPRAAGS